MRTGDRRSRRRSRRRRGAGAVLAGLVGLVGPALSVVPAAGTAASPPPRCGDAPPADGSVRCVIEDGAGGLPPGGPGGPGDGAPDAPAPGGGPAPPDPETLGLVPVALDALSRDGQGRTCTTSRTVWVPPFEVSTTRRLAAIALQRDLDGLRDRGVEPRPCAAGPGDPGGATGRRVREVVLRRLPAPRPEIPPGYGLVGKRMFLVTGGATSWEPAPIAVEVLGRERTVELRATGTFRVDWGDGTVTGPHHTPGAPWPEGRITHVWDEHGTYDVRVHEDWRVRWRVDGGAWASFALTPPPERIPDFAVRGLEPVRRR